MVTLSLQNDLAALVAANPQLGSMNQAELMEAACTLDVGLWAEWKRGVVNAPFHWAWYDLAAKVRRLAILAPPGTRQVGDLLREQRSPCLDS